jgi:hypothetical protein
MPPYRWSRELPRALYFRIPLSANCWRTVTMTRHTKGNKLSRVGPNVALTAPNACPRTPGGIAGETVSRQIPDCGQSTRNPALRSGFSAYANWTRDRLKFPIASVCSRRVICNTIRYELSSSETRR